MSTRGVHWLVTTFDWSASSGARNRSKTRLISLWKLLRGHAWYWVMLMFQILHKWAPIHIGMRKT
jgi:hypothetical protein